MKVTIKDVQAAREQISKIVRKTPIEYSAAFSQLANSEIFLKCENLQLTGSFKIRGALNKISSLTEAERARGVIAASAGNHAQGVALSASKLKVKSTIVMPRHASLVKQLATRNYGAEVILHGEIYDEAYQQAREVEKRTGAIFVHPFEDPLIIAGQGTIALELFEEIPDLDSIVVPIGGGGLISGIALAAKTLNPKIKVYGVVAENAPGMFAMFKDQDVRQDLSYMSIADGIAVKKPSPLMFENFIKKYVDGIYSVSEDQIAEAIAFLLERAKLVVEGSGAVTLAAVLSRQIPLGKKTGLILSGGNIDLNLVGEILDRGLSRSGRITRISVVVDDRPGVLQKLTKIVADQEANILNVEHDRTDPSLRIRETRISFILETRNAEHAADIRAAMVIAGIRLI